MSRAETPGGSVLFCNRDADGRFRLIGIPLKFSMYFLRENDSRNGNMRRNKVGKEGAAKQHKTHLRGSGYFFVCRDHPGLPVVPLADSRIRILTAQSPFPVDFLHRGGGGQGFYL